MKRLIQMAVGAVLALAAISSAHDPIVLLPLGDSITAGSDGGYRKPLMAKLTEIDHAATTVGSQTDPALPAGSQAHEGHPGWRIDQLADNLLGGSGVDGGAAGGHWLKGGADTGRGPIHPTIVTVMAGINDINQMIGDGTLPPMSERSDVILQTLQTRLKALVGTLNDNLPDATILLGGCIPYNNGLLKEAQTGATEANRNTWASRDRVSPQQEMGVNHFVILFNRWIREAYVPELQKVGKKVEYVDVYAKFILPDGSVRGWDNNEPAKTLGPAAYADYGLHPNLFGYGLMADAWAAAITARAEK